MTGLTEIEKLDEAITNSRENAVTHAKVAVTSGLVVVILISLIITITLLAATTSGDAYLLPPYIVILFVLASVFATFAGESASRYIKNRLAHDEAVAERAALIS